MHFDSLNGFILGLSWAFGIFIFLFNKLVMEPFSLWIRNKYPEKTWLWSYLFILNYNRFIWSNNLRTKILITWGFFYY
jgi:hypothetical protein